MPEQVLRIIPFHFLSAQRRALLMDCLEPHEFAIGEQIIVQGNTDDRVYLLAMGSVDIVDYRRTPPKQVGVIEAPAYFGERMSLFEQARQYTIEATSAVQAWSMPGSAFTELIAQSAPFAASLAQILRMKQGIFVEYECFLADLHHSVAKGHIILQKLLKLYHPLEPALHTKSRSTEIDFDGLGYAVRRLPQNITRTFSWFFTYDLPFRYSRPHRTFLQVPTAARRRTVYEMLPGKNLVLLRDGESDLVDLVCCLCVYAVEAHKIRSRLSDPDVLHALCRSEGANDP
ncbi:MAG: cyclic nucleotide-binding domain-containing protein, partial [Proteobacteria bacterium]|nr:cyclic nucleotide-binding domain-containing protein [Pseudomonadota bacterium]